MNAAAIPETLVEAEFFGAEKGSYTGADRTRKGKLEQAQGGTLFLDELGELPLPLQPKLLRALQEGVVTRIGGAVGDRHRRADPRRHEPRPRAGGGRRPVPRGPLLPPQRRLGDAPAASRAARGRAAPRPTLRRADRAALRHPRRPVPAGAPRRASSTTPGPATSASWPTSSSGSSSSRKGEGSPPGDLPEPLGGKGLRPTPAGSSRPAASRGRSTRRTPSGRRSSSPGGNRARAARLLDLPVQGIPLPAREVRPRAVGE